MAKEHRDLEYSDNSQIKLKKDEANNGRRKPEMNHGATCFAFNSSLIQNQKDNNCYKPITFGFQSFQNATKDDNYGPFCRRKTYHFYVANLLVVQIVLISQLYVELMNRMCKLCPLDLEKF